MDELPAPRNLDPASFDRTDFTPYHEGANVLPHDYIFHRLYFLAAYQNTTAVRDTYNGLEVDYRQLLTDIIFARNRIRDAVSTKTMEMIRNNEEVSILVVARGYEFVVSFFAVLALGAIAVPQSKYYRI